MLDYSREFIELVMCLNYEKAAHRLNLSASTLSRHIADLERELGFKLLDRNPLQLTRAGQFYLERISSIIDDLDTVVARARRLATEGGRELSVWYLPSNPVSEVVQEAACRIEDESDHITTCKFCIDGRTLTPDEALIEREADVSIMYAPLNPNETRLKSEVLCTLPVCAWIHKNSVAARRNPKSLADLASLSIPMTVIQQTRDWTTAILLAFASCGVTPDLHLRTLYDRAGFYRSLRNDEVLIDFMGDDTPLVYNPDLVKVVPTEGVTECPVFIAYRVDEADPQVLAYIEYCRSIARLNHPPKQQ